MTPFVNNLIVAALAAGAIWLWRTAARDEGWRAAWAVLRARRGARASLVVLAGYVLVGVADSVVWRDPVRDDAGRIVRGSSGGVQLESLPRSRLDRTLARWLAGQERTYSAPFAARATVAETVRGPDGRITRERPPLRHPRRHPLGTDRVGNDVLVRALKGVRTGLVIGGFTTLLVIPLAVAFGALAGYFGRWVDTLIRYVYTLLDSIPDVLLIASFILIAGHSLTALCVIMGVTSWTHLCRLVRGETLKLRELEYVQAARALGAGHLRVLLRHVVPNLMHVVVIVFVLRFSGLVLTEAVLTYLGLGVDPSTGSWGHMINAARQELTREPAVWWNLAAAFAFMLGLVLPANLLGDALRDALDPRLRSER